MKQVADNTRRIADLERRLETMQQLAKVSSINEANHRVDVKIRDLELKGLPFLTWRAGSEAKTYWVPEVGELGLLMCPAGDVGNAFFMPALFYADSEAPEKDKNIMLRIFSNGVEEKWDGNDDTYTLRVGSGTERKTEKSGKIEDKTGTAKLTLEQSGSAKIEASSAIAAELTTILGNFIGAHFFPTGITNLQSPVGPVFFAPAPSPASAPTPPAESAPDRDGNVTKTPTSTISGVEIQATSNIVITLTAPVAVVTPAGAGSIVTGTQIRGTVTGTIKLQFPARDL